MNDEKSNTISRHLRKMRNDVLKIKDMVVSCKEMLSPHKYKKMMDEINRITIQQEKVSKKLRYKYNVLTRNNNKMIKKIKELEKYDNGS